ncbi:MAG TPA: sugar ABC transporter permease, partial [Saliniramus sp.]|nr:sugar ABC transporter permease [Saliniramus sp.]
MTTTAHAPAAPAKKSLFDTLEIDTRLLGMIGAFLFLCFAFDFATDGRFLTPRNIFNL